MQSWREHADELHRASLSLRVTDARGKEVKADAAFKKWHGWTKALRQARGTVYLIGNGASASMASHYAADLAKNGRLHTEVFSDLSLITAISNDMGYEHVFAEPLRRRGNKGDMLVAISSSGRSPNILAAAGIAAEIGLTIVTLSAMKPDNPLRKTGHLNFYAPADQYGLAETCHAAALHWWMDLVQGKPE